MAALAPFVICTALLAVCWLALTIILLQ